MVVDHPALFASSRSHTFSDSAPAGVIPSPHSGSTCVHLLHSDYSLLATQLSAALLAIVPPFLLLFTAHYHCHTLSADPVLSELPSTSFPMAHPTYSYPNLTGP